MIDLNSAWLEAAVEAALAARLRAYAPYSQFLVGAAIVDESGKLCTGCNIENASYSLTNCAERVAVQRAWFELTRPWNLLVVASTKAVTPCGACRQVLSEFAPQLPVVLVDCDDPNQRVFTSVDRLLPGAFQLEQ